MYQTLNINEVQMYQTLNIGEVQMYQTFIVTRYKCIKLSMYYHLDKIQMHQTPNSSISV